MLNKKTICAGLMGLMLASPVMAQVVTPSAPSAVPMNQDAPNVDPNRTQIPTDKTLKKGNKSQLHQDRAQLKQAKANGDTATVKQLHQKIRAEKAQSKAAQQQVNPQPGVDQTNGAPVVPMGAPAN